jgi:transcriptional regulator with XRE-family HTH domain
MDAIAREFGAQVRALRQERGMTQERLAELTGMSRNQIQNIEHSRNNKIDEFGQHGRANPTLDTIWSLAYALDVDVTELLRRDVS